ncbi:MAG: hypothetical protein AAFZ65_09595 [Planctomycetota bacterium]
MTPLLLLAHLTTLSSQTAPDLEVGLRTAPLGSIPLRAAAAEPLGVARFGKLVLTIESTPGARVLVALVPGGSGDGWALDDPGRLWLANGLDDPRARVGPDGRFVLEAWVPGELPIGLDLSLQALTLDEATATVAASTAIELTVESRFEFDFARSSGGWIALGDGRLAQDGWRLDEGQAIGRSLAGLEPDGDYAIELGVRSTPLLEAAAGPSVPALEGDAGAWAPLTRTEATLELSADPDGRAWVVLRAPRERAARIESVDLVIRR